jgi:branched-chain amino acid transport system permease protein
VIAIQLLNGLALGVLLLVLASGLAMIYGLRGVINFSHGALYTLGAYVGLTVSQVGFWPALVVAPLALAGLGALLDLGGLRFISHRGQLPLLLVTYGLALVLNDAVLGIWGPEDRSLPPPSGLDGSVRLFGEPYPAYRLFLVMVGLVVGGLLLLWLRSSRTGLYVRAAARDRELTAVMGVNVDRTSTLVVALGAGLAGLAGVLAGPYLSLSPSMGTQILVDSFVVVVVGGLGSIGGAMIAALLLGMLQVIGTVLVPELAALAPYALMVAVLLWRPAGLLGRSQQ